ncbi:MAG: hypothetical protein ACOC1X_02765 [Promethearchaeota archaeon]
MSEEDNKATENKKNVKDEDFDAFCNLPEIETDTGMTINTLHLRFIDNKLNKALMMVKNPEGEILYLEEQPLNFLFTDNKRKKFMKNLGYPEEVWLTHAKTINDQIHSLKNMYLSNDKDSGKPKKLTDEDKKKLKKTKEFLPEKKLKVVIKILSVNHVGDTGDGVLLFLEALSSRTKYKLMSQIRGDSSGGKSDLQKAVLKHMIPDEYIKWMGPMSEKALRHSDWESSTESIIAIPDIDEIPAELRFFSIDDDNITISVTMGSSESGFYVKEIKIPPKTIISASTLLEVDRQFENRVIYHNVDTSAKQTEKVVDRIAEEASTPPKFNKKDFKSTEFFKQYIRELNTYDDIVVPFAPELKQTLQSFNDVRIRRDFNKIISYVRVMAFFNQDKRWKSKDGKTLYAMPEDFTLIAPYLQEAFYKTITGMNTRMQTIIDRLKSLPHDNPVTYEDVSNYLEGAGIKASKTTIRDEISILENNGYVKVDRSKKPHEVKYWKDPEEPITITDEIKQKLKDKTREKIEELIQEDSNNIALPEGWKAKIV